MEKMNTISTGISGRKADGRKVMDDYMPLYECSRWMSGLPCEEMKDCLLKGGFQVVEHNGEEWVKTKDFNRWLDIQMGMAAPITGDR